IGLLAEIYNVRAEFARAEAITRDVASRVGSEDRAYYRAALLAEIQHAHALAGLGDLESANAELAALMQRHCPRNDPVSVGLVHRSQAQLALVECDAPRFEMHLGAMERLFRATENPALVAMCERLRHEFRRSRTARSGEYAMNAEENVSRHRRSHGG